MPFPKPILLVNAAAEGFADESATFVRGAQVSAKTRDWLASGMALPLTWSVVNGCAASFSDCPGGALKVVATGGTGSGGRTWSATCVFSDSKGRMFVRSLKGTVLSSAIEGSLFDCNSRWGGDVVKALEAAGPPSAIHPNTAPAGSVAAKLALEARTWLDSVWPHLQMVDTQGLAPGGRMSFSGFPEARPWQPRMQGGPSAQSIATLHQTLLRRSPIGQRLRESLDGAEGTPATGQPASLAGSAVPISPAPYVELEAVELECQAVGRPSQPHRPQKELRRRQQQQQQQ